MLVQLLLKFSINALNINLLFENNYLFPELIYHNMTELGIGGEVQTLTIEEERQEQRPRSPREGKTLRKRINLDEVEIEFQKFASKLRKQFGKHGLSIQISRHQGNLKFSFQVDKKKKRKELTEEQKTKKAEKKAKWKAKRKEKLENSAKDKMVEDINTNRKYIEMKTQDLEKDLQEFEQYVHDFEKKMKEKISAEDENERGAL